MGILGVAFGQRGEVARARFVWFTLAFWLARSFCCISPRVKITGLGGSLAVV